MKTYQTLAAAAAARADRPFVIEGTDFSGEIVYFPSFSPLAELRGALASGVGIVGIHDVRDQWPADEQAVIESV